LKKVEDIEKKKEKVFYWKVRSQKLRWAARTGDRGKRKEPQFLQRGDQRTQLDDSGKKGEVQQIHSLALKVDIGQGGFFCDGD